MNERKISDELTISGQPAQDELENIGERGYRTVVNLRTPDEPGAVPDEERLVEGAGITYASIPVAPDTLDDLAMQRFQGAVTSVDSQPALVHCRSGGRAGIMVLLHLAVQHGWTVQQALEEGHERGDIAPSPTSPYRAFFESYVKRHSTGER